MSTITKIMAFVIVFSVLDYCEPVLVFSKRIDSRRRALPVWIDMAPAGRAVPRALACRADTRDPAFAWTGGMVRFQIRPRVSDLWFSGFAESDDATLLIAVDPPDSLYSITLTLGDPISARGPVEIEVNGEVLNPVLTTSGERCDVVAQVQAADGRIEITLRTQDCQLYALSGISVAGPTGAKLGRLLSETSTALGVPDPSDLAHLGEEEACDLLSEFSSFLIETRPRQGGFSYHGAWYQNAYAIRALLPAGLLLNDPKLVLTGLECLDEFVSQQCPDANWFSTYHVRAACHTLATADSSSANLADIGTMTTALSIAAQVADVQRRSVYLDAAIRYADAVSLPSQLESGAFPNGRFGGRVYVTPYSVATATQTASLAMLFQATGSTRYLEASDRGARWLARNSFLVDGRFMLYPHDRVKPLERNATDFGNAFYVADALILARSVTQDDSLRREIDDAMRHWLFGAKGLQAEAAFGYWWASRDAWSDSKMAATLYVLASSYFMEPSEIGGWCQNVLGWMGNPKYRKSIGITSDPMDSRAEYALPATSFAALGIAAVLTSSHPCVFGRGGQVNVPGRIAP